MKSKFLPRIASIGLVLTIASANLLANTHPEPKKIVSPQFSIELEQQETVMIKVDINKYGYVTSATVAESTNDALNACSLKAINQWTFTPSTENGQAVASTFIQPFNYNTGSIDLAKGRKVTDKAPRATSRIAPQLPEDVAGISGYVNLRVEISDSGEINSVSLADASHEELVPYAKDALLKWKFKPAIIDGVAQASSVIAPFNFNGSKIEETVTKSIEVAQADKMPKPIKRFEPTLPLSMEQERGEAKILLYVDEHGYVAKTDILKTSDHQLGELASEAAMQWKFKPAIKDGRPVASKVQLPFVFNGGLLLSQTPVDTMPIVKVSKSPKLSKESEDIDGYVRVILQLDNQGNVVSAAANQSTHETLVQPSIEAAKSWKFKPAIRDGEAVKSQVVIPFVFGNS